MQIKVTRKFYLISSDYQPSRKKNDNKCCQVQGKRNGQGLSMNGKFTAFTDQWVMRIGLPLPLGLQAHVIMQGAGNLNSGYLPTQQVFLPLNYLSCHNFKEAAGYFLWRAKLADFHPPHTKINVSVKYRIHMGRRHGQVKSLYWLYVRKCSSLSNTVNESEKADGFVFSARWQNQWDL